MDGRRNSNDLLVSPSHCPASVTYKQKMNEMKKKQQEGVTQLLSKITRGGPETKRFKLKDGSLLTIHQNGPAVRYDLKLPDGRQVILERNKQDMALQVFDSSGKAIKSLACEL